MRSEHWSSALMLGSWLTVVQNKCGYLILISAWVAEAYDLI
jgi:hypothetical protein